MSFITTASPTYAKSHAIDDIREELPHLYVMLKSEPGYNLNPHAQKIANTLSDVLIWMGEDIDRLERRVDRAKEVANIYASELRAQERAAR